MDQLNRGAQLSIRLKPTLLLHLLHHAHRALHITNHRTRFSHTPLRFLTIRITPHTIIFARLSETCCILIPLDAFSPFTTDVLAVN